MKTKLILFLALLALCSSGVRATVTQPTLTTDVNNPVYYKIGSYDRGGFLTYNGTNNNVTHEALTPDALWYFVENGSGVSIVPASNPSVKLVTHSSLNSTGAVWYLGENPYNSGYFCISRNSDFSANCLDASNSGLGVGYYQPYQNDWKGTSWSITLVSNEDVATLRTSYSSNQMTPSIPKGKMISFGDAVTSFTAASSADDNTHWYVMTQTKEGPYGGVLETPIWNSSTGSKIMRAPTSVTTATLSDDLAHQALTYMVRFIDVGEGLYHIQFADGTFVTSTLTTNTRNTQAGTYAFYNTQTNSTTFGWNLGSEDGSCVDNNGANANLVFWSSGKNTATTGNNVWFLYPVSFDDFTPTADNVYTFNNTNSDRGALMYYPTASNKWVWSSGKSGSFDETDANCQWIIKPTGISDQYYLYNVGAQKFAVPTSGGTYGGYSWSFSSNAVPVTLNMQSDGTYKFITASGSIYCAVSNSYLGPIISYNDVGGNFTISRVGDTSSDVATQLTTNVNMLVDKSLALTDKPSEDGWYMIRVKTGDNADNFIYTSKTEINFNGTNYPLTFTNYKEHPSIADATYFFHIAPTKTDPTWQMPNGKFLTCINNKFPVSTTDVGYMGLTKDTSNGGFNIWNVQRAVPYYNINGTGKTIVGESSSTIIYYDFYPINLATAGLTAWQVIIDASSTATQVSCSRTDVSGLATVYNNGYIFLPTDVTPTVSDFSVTVDDGTTFAIDSDAKTVTAIQYENAINNYLSAKNVEENVGFAGKVGYPKSSNEYAVALSSLLGTITSGNYNAMVYKNLKEWYPPYLTATDVQLPEEGKTYTIANYAKDGTLRYLYNNNGTIGLTTDSELTDDYKFICHINSSDKFIMAMPNGNYLVWKGNGEGINGAKGQTSLAEITSNERYPLTLQHFALNGISNDIAFGKLQIIGHRSNTQYSSLIVATTENPIRFDHASTTNFFSDSYSSAWVITEVDSYYNKVKLSSDGENAYASLYLPFSVTIPEGITAYAVESQNGVYAHMEAIVTNGTLPKETPAILKKNGLAANETVYLSPAEDAGSFDGTNILGGTATTTSRESLGTGSTYVLGNGGDGLGLYNYTGTNLAKGKAYLFLPGAGVRSLIFDFDFDDEDATAIANVNVNGNADNAAIYNIAGQRISKLQKGINIVNGKKVLY